MAGSLNKVQLIGNVGRDPEMKYLASGEAMTTFSVATNRRWRGQDGQTHEQTEWHTVVAWRTLAEQCGVELHTQQGFGTGLWAEIERRHRSGRDADVVRLEPALPRVLEAVPDPDPELEGRSRGVHLG